MKTDKTRLIRFCRLTKNQPVQFDFFKNLKIFEIKNPKKLGSILRILVKKEFKNLSYCVLEKLRKVWRVLKSKKDLTGSF
jgi:hypothetical protein